MPIDLRSTAVKTVPSGTQMTLSSTDFLSGGTPTAPMAGDVVQVTLGGSGYDIENGNNIPELPNDPTGWITLGAYGNGGMVSELVRLLYVVPPSGFATAAWPVGVVDGGYPPLSLIATCWSGVDNATPRDNPSQERFNSGGFTGVVETPFRIPLTGNGYITGASAAMVLMTVVSSTTSATWSATPPTGMELAGRTIAVSPFWQSVAVYYQNGGVAGTNVGQKVATSSVGTKDKIGWVWGLKNYVAPVTPPASVIIKPKIGWGILL